MSQELQELLQENKRQNEEMVKLLQEINGLTKNYLEKMEDVSKELHQVSDCLEICFKKLYGI